MKYIDFFSFFAKAEHSLYSCRTIFNRISLVLLLEIVLMSSEGYTTQQIKQMADLPQRKTLIFFSFFTSLKKNYMTEVEQPLKVVIEENISENIQIDKDEHIFEALKPSEVNVNSNLKN